MEQKDSIVHTNNTRGKAHKPLSKGTYPFKLTNESSDMINTPNTSTIIDHAIDIVGGGIVKRDWVGDREIEYLTHHLEATPQAKYLLANKLII